MSFKNFLLNEQKSYLGHKVNDVLTTLQDIQNDIENLGTRHLSRLAENIVNEIRKIIHGQWEVQHHAHLKDLQKIGVALMKAIEEKGDLKETIPAAAQALQDVAGKLGVKVNALDAPEMPGEPVSDADFEETGDGPPVEDPNAAPPDPNAQQPQLPPADPAGGDPMAGMGGMGEMGDVGSPGM